MPNKTILTTSRALTWGIFLTVVIVLFLLFCPGIDGVFTSVKAWELTTQFFMIGILGSIVGFFIRNREAKISESKAENKQKHDDNENRKEILREFYVKFIKLHNEYKKIRREVRAYSYMDTSMGWLIQRSKYEKLMDRLEDAQLRAEELHREASIHPAINELSDEEITTSLKSIEGYLNNVLSDFEKNFEIRKNLKEDELFAIKNEMLSFIASPASDIVKERLFDPAGRVRSNLKKKIFDTTHAS